MHGYSSVSLFCVADLTHNLAEGGKLSILNHLHPVLLGYVLEPGMIAPKHERHHLGQWRRRGLIKDWTE
ncbi:hypothetical protein [Spirosoma validum]|uniref:Uncharacterized protein n=1 Tax=Spirosoma validum TaxID=2771355 RepID=A0A927GDM7_9BACT|nr:hypothetical protein [Spirosoma validum]MBD2753731.1 hypothetical protein [Spirosoma validum]